METAIAGFRRSSDRSEQAPARSRQLQDEPPVSQDELEQVVHEYRRVHEEHRRAKLQSRARRRLERRLQRLRRRFESLLAHAALSEDERRRWHDRLRGDAAAPGSPTELRPLLFCGRSDSGSELRLVSGARGTIDALVDGAAAAVLDDAEELTRTTPGFVFALDDLAFRETFAASPSALGDLRGALETGRPPGSEYVRELIEDGLVDRALGVTARGRRALALDRVPARRVERTVVPAISIRGPVPQPARENLARALTHVSRHASRPVLRITGSLTRHVDPALARPVVAAATIDVSGRPVRARGIAPSEDEAIRRLEYRLHRSLRRLAERDLAERRTGR